MKSDVDVGDADAVSTDVMALLFTLDTTAGDGENALVL